MTGENHRARNDRAEARKLMARTREEGRHSIIQWSTPLFKAADAELFREIAGFDFASREKHRQWLEKSGRKILDDIQLSSVDGERMAMMLNLEFYRLAEFAVADAAVEPPGEKIERLNRISKSASAALNDIQGLCQNLGFSESYLSDISNEPAQDVRSYHLDIVELAPYFRNENRVFDFLPPTHHLRSIVLWLGQISAAAASMGAAVAAFPEQFRKYPYTNMPIYSAHPQGLRERNPEDELALGLVRVWKDCTGGMPVRVSKNNEFTTNSPAAVWAAEVLKVAAERLPNSATPSEGLEMVVEVVRKTLGKRLAEAQRALNKAAKV